MKKSLLLGGACLLMAATSQMANAQAWSQGFSSGMPSNWVTINDANTPSSTALTATAVTAMKSAGWAVINQKGASDPCAYSISAFTPSGTADRWMITHSFAVSAGQYLTWEDFSLQTPVDSLEILVSPTAGTTAADFTASIYKGAAPNANTTGTYANTHLVSLASYVGQTIRVAFREHTTNKLAVLVDNIAVRVVPNVDMAMTSLTPAASSPAAYGMSGSTVTFKGTVKNNGATAVSSYTLNYQQGTNPVVSMPMSGTIAPLTSATFTATTPYTVPATAGQYPIKAWVTITNDADHTNDSAKTTVTSVTRMPEKKLVIEEATGTWCGWCVRGIVYMDSIQKMHPNNVSLIAVHNQDPMVVAAYDTWMGTKIGGYPSVVIDRREVADPSDIITVYNNEKSYFGFADITLGTPTKTSTSYTQPVTVKPALNLNGDYRLVMVITEDNVHSTDTAYSQHNYYSSASQNIPLSGGGINYQTSPVWLPTSKSIFNFVARAITPSVTGNSGALPAAMTLNSTYSATLTATLGSSWVASKLRAVVMLVDNATGAVLNTENRMVMLGVSNTQVGIEGLRVFPNPAQDAAQVAFKLVQPSSVTVQLVDATGRLVATQAMQMAAGAQQVKINTSAVAAGIYNVVVRTENGMLSERLSVVK